MSANNLRIIYDNVIDSATISASSTAGGLVVSNTQRERKGLVWRSASTPATVTATWTTPQTLSGVALPFCNLSPTATLRIRVYTQTADTTPVLDTGVVSAGAYTPSDVWGGSQQWSTTPAAYSLGGGTYARAWFPETVGRKLEIIISDPNNLSGYIELSRIVCGRYWAPVYNTSFGVQVGMIDTSEQTRTESGNFITSVGTTHKTLSFDLAWLTETDRDRLFGILRGNGLRKPLYVSLFPQDDSREKEQLYQIYGKLNTLNALVHPLFTVYSTSLTLEEI